MAKNADQGEESGYFLLAQLLENSSFRKENKIFRAYFVQYEEIIFQVQYWYIVVIYNVKGAA